MRTWLLMGLALGLIPLIGCGKTENRPASEFEAPKPDSPNSTAMSSAEVSELEESDFSPHRESALTEKLNRSPNDTNLLLRLAKLTQTNAGVGEERFANFKKAAAYLHRALKINPQIVESTAFGDAAREIYYHEACALAREWQDEASIKSLVLSVQYGWTDFRQMSIDPDWERIRKNPRYADFEKARALAAIEPVFAIKRHFHFDFDLIDTDGRPLKKSSFAGKVLMVNIWGTWCSPCIAEIPDLVAAYEKFKDRGFELIGLNQENETTTSAVKLIKKIQEQNHITYRCALAERETLDQVPNLMGFPTSLFFDRTGQLKGVAVGAVDGEKLELIIERLLRESGEPAN